MKIYLMRHGQADPGMSSGRYGLTSRGQEDVRAVASKLKRDGVSPHQLWHSGKTRAEETAEIVWQVLGSSFSCEKKAGLLPEDSAQAAAEMIQEWFLEHRDQNLMIVSHLPFLPALVAVFLGDTFSYSGFSPAACMGLKKRPDENWEFDSFIDPLDLP